MRNMIVDLVNQDSTKETKTKNTTGKFLEKKKTLQSTKIFFLYL